MKSRRRSRKQHVALRARRRNAIQGNVQRMMRRGLVAAIFVGGMLALGSQGDAIAARWMVTLAPNVQVQAPEAFPTLIVEPEYPQNRAWLWFPWVRSTMEKKLLKKHPMVQKIVCEKDWGSRHMVFKPLVRKPMVRVGPGMVMDSEGSVFPWAVASAASLPGLQVLGAASQPALARWVQRLSMQQVLWQKIVLIKQDRNGFLTMELQSGTKVFWGPPEMESLEAKSRAALSVLNDAQTTLRAGAASADLRFFSDGRIIVSPKK